LSFAVSRRLMLIHARYPCRHSASPYPLSLITRRPPSSTLFPYTTLFRSELRAFNLQLLLVFLPSREPGDFDVDASYGEVKVEIADRKSTRLNSSHVKISYAVFCLKKKNIKSPISHQILQFKHDACLFVLC